MTAKPIRRMIFDNDGVNVDSEDVAMRVMDDWGVELIRLYKPEVELPQDYIYKTYPGTSTDRIVDALIKKFDLEPALIRQDYDIPEGTDIAVALAHQITLATNDRFKTGLKSIPGATAALTEIIDILGHENIALATTSRADRMDVSLECATDPDSGQNARLAEIFPQGPRRRSGYGFENKYDEAFGGLKWDPAETAIVEDSLSGVTKAKKGRPDVRVIGTVAAKFYEDKPAQASALLTAGATLVISDYSDLPAAAQWLSDGMDPNARPAFWGSVYLPETPAGPVAKPQTFVLT